MFYMLFQPVVNVAQQDDSVDDVDVDVEHFNDDDFYHQLLKDLIERKSQHTNDNNTDNNSADAHVLMTRLFVV